MSDEQIFLRIREFAENPSLWRLSPTYLRGYRVWVRDIQYFVSEPGFSPASAFKPAGTLAKGHDFTGCGLYFEGDGLLARTVLQRKNTAALASEGSVIKCIVPSAAEAGFHSRLVCTA